MRLRLGLPIALISLALVSGCVESTGDVVGAAKLQSDSTTLFLNNGERPEPVSIALTDSDYWLRPQALPSADIISLRNGRATAKKVHIDFTAPASILVGTHTETLLLDVCSDSTCGSLASNSPLTYTVTITNAYEWRDDRQQNSTVKALLVAEGYGNEIASILADQLGVWVDTAELWEAESTQIAGDRLLRQLRTHTSKVSIVDLAQSIRSALPEDRFVEADSLGIAYNWIDDGLLSASDITDLWGYYFDAVDQVAKLVDAAKISLDAFSAEALPYLQAFNLTIEDTESLEAYRQAVGFNYPALYKGENEIQGFSDLANTFEMCSSEARKDWIVEHLREKYYWNTSLPAQIDTSDASESWRDIFYANLDARDQDKEGYSFSWIASNESWYDFLQGSGSDIGVKFLRTQNDTWIASRIHADGNGHRYGLRRGDEVVFVDNDDADVVRLTRLSDNRSFSIPRAEYAQDAFIGPLFTERANQKVAYLNLYAFNTAADYQTARVYQMLLDGAPDSLVLDLRDNSGGSTVLAEGIMSMIIQDAEASRAGETLLEYRYNASRPSSYSEIGDFAGLNLNEVIVLTGPNTCSASELIINGLKPYIQTVVSIGETTCGKPYGMEVEDYCGHTIAPITFETLNKLGQGGYNAGIAPTCEIVDPIDGEFGDVNETLYAAALTYIETGNCPVNPRRSTVSPIQVPKRPIGNLVFD